MCVCVHGHVCVCVCVRACVRACACVCLHAWTCVCVCVRACVRACVHKLELLFVCLFTEGITDGDVIRPGLRMCSSSAELLNISTGSVSLRGVTAPPATRWERWEEWREIFRYDSCDETSFYTLGYVDVIYIN